MNHNTAPAMKAVSECGFGTCAGDHDCLDRWCPEHPSKTSMLGLPVYDSMTPEPHLLHRVDASQLRRNDKARFTDGTNPCDLPIEMIEPVKSVISGAEWLKTAAMVIAAMLALACTFYVSTI